MYGNCGFNKKGDQYCKALEIWCKNVYRKNQIYHQFYCFQFGNCGCTLQMLADTGVGELRSHTYGGCASHDALSGNSYTKV